MAFSRKKKTIKGYITKEIAKAAALTALKAVAVFAAKTVVKNVIKNTFSSTEKKQIPIDLGTQGTVEGVIKEKAPKKLKVKGKKAIWS